MLQEGIGKRKHEERKTKLFVTQLINIMERDIGWTCNGSDISPLTGEMGIESRRVNRPRSERKYNQQQ